MRPFRWMSLAFATSLGGCSLYPIPDDVSFYKTEHIVRYSRCEVRKAIFDHLVERKFIPEPTISQVEKKIKEVEKKQKFFPKTLDDQDDDFLRLLRVAIVYSFDFNITEINRAGAGGGFRLPGLTNALDVGATASVDLTRQGSRVFGTEDNWGSLITDSKLCHGIDDSLLSSALHPLTGSIGVGRVVETFLDIDDQRGAKDNFVDTMTFTTLTAGTANASLVITPVPNEFRPIAASASLGASRLDIHKLTVSLAFPQASRGGISRVVRFDGDLNAPEGRPFARPPVWRARYNLCVQDARTRELSFKLLRLTDPLVYCIAYADAFAPQYGKSTVKTVKRDVIETPKAGRSKDGAELNNLQGQSTNPERRTIMRTERRTITTSPERENYKPFLQ